MRQIILVVHIELILSPGGEEAPSPLLTRLLQLHVAALQEIEGHVALLLPGRHHVGTREHRLGKFGVRFSQCERLGHDPGYLKWQQLPHDAELKILLSVLLPNRLIACKTWELTSAMDP